MTAFTMPSTTIRDMTIGLINDMFMERENDDLEYGYKAQQSDFEQF